MIEKGAVMLGYDLNTLFEKTLKAMRFCEKDIADAMENER